ncbi:MAG: GNAT family N-acetyltransferase [Armatimonadetes bacterium]|nr:GNAT family N-acetyltransferase [Armatimonadota bacterium]
MESVVVTQMLPEHIPGAVALQRLCFPEPFPEEFLWKAHHLESHLHQFPEGQFVAVNDGAIIGSASSLIVSEDVWAAHMPWATTVGGPFFENFNSHGTTLYGADISVHPEYRQAGIGRSLYEARFKLVEDLSLTRYGTACRIPGFIEYYEETGGSPTDYVLLVNDGIRFDRTLSPLLRYGLTLGGVIEEYMEDAESGNAAAVLEWTP